MGEELVYDLFGVVFFAFFAVTIVAFRKPLPSYCAASFVVSSVLMTSVFNLGYMLPHLVRSICRLERALRVVIPPGTDEQQPGRHAALSSMSKSLVNMRGLPGPASLTMRSTVISPPIVNPVAGGAGAMAAGAREEAASRLSSSGVSGCLAIMLLVCACSALLVAVSVGMVLEANVIEQERERQIALTSKEAREFSSHDNDNNSAEAETAAAAPLLPQSHRQRQQLVCCCQGQGPCGRGGVPQQPPSAVLRAAVWINNYVGIDELRYTGVTKKALLCKVSQARLISGDPPSPAMRHTRVHTTTEAEILSEMMPTSNHAQLATPVTFREARRDATAGNTSACKSRLWSPSNPPHEHRNADTGVGSSELVELTSSYLRRGAYAFHGCQGTTRAWHMTPSSAVHADSPGSPLCWDPKVDRASDMQGCGSTRPRCLGVGRGSSCVEVCPLPQLHPDTRNWDREFFPNIPSALQPPNRSTTLGNSLSEIASKRNAHSSRTPATAVIMTAASTSSCRKKLTMVSPAA
ncbi:uncharacterized protein B0I36DRAFT_356465 [Microdochium trichocladiopsis]|uniref:Uncharacterized protein n=1 Tax=Microdochium trichocladiopsis TaxID=1682393 RepID=A0A9P8XRU7_9PEZI|nr:uncharacterized protein B0I36DRAFT_356465 [Microdochium trichocladiopsis]KAH7010868.1 hypothetical protein B0I36DRAFT_356465 [Microdochium trichocladiopsis]